MYNLFLLVHKFQMNDIVKVEDADLIKQIYYLFNPKCSGEHVDKQMEKIDLAQNFVEFFGLSSNCKYNGCLHMNEPSCYVKELVNKNEILKSRYENYLTFINDLGKDKKEYDSSPINSNSKRRRKK